MRIARYTTCAIGIAIALTLSATARAGAQVDTTRRAVSQKRIPVKKDQGAKLEARGEVALPADARINALEATAVALNQRIESVERANATLTARSAETDRLLNTLTDSLRMVRGELSTLRSELANANARTRMLDDSVQGLSRRVHALGHHSYLFGNSGFYVGLGTGANFPMGALRDLNYSNGLNVTVPIGWSKLGSLIGIRTEWSVQGIEGRVQGAFTNLDPKVYSGVGMVTVNLPVNVAKTNKFYLMGGGGVYQFREFGNESSLNAAFTGSQTSSTNVTKWGINAGVGYEFHILGATSGFAQSSFTNVSADQIIQPATNKSLRWVPLIVGVTLR